MYVFRRLEFQPDQLIQNLNLLSARMESALLIVLAVLAPIFLSE